MVLWSKYRVKKIKKKSLFGQYIIMGKAGGEGGESFPLPLRFIPVPLLIRGIWVHGNVQDSLQEVSVKHPLLWLGQQIDAGGHTSVVALTEAFEVYTVS